MVSEFDWLLSVDITKLYHSVTMSSKTLPSGLYKKLDKWLGWRVGRLSFLGTLASKISRNRGQHRERRWCRACFDAVDHFTIVQQTTELDGTGWDVME